MMDTKVEEALRLVNAYAGSITDWKVLKKELLKNLPFQQRKLFSTRDPLTKKQNFNEFEEVVCKRWKDITGIDVIFKRNEED
jgi:hypothetical protein